METIVQLPLKEYEKLKRFEQINKEILESENYSEYYFILKDTNREVATKAITKEEYVKTIVEECVKLRKDNINLRKLLYTEKECFSELLAITVKSKKKWWQK